MRRYILIKDAEVNSIDGMIVIPKGTKALHEYFVDGEDGAVVKINDGEYKDKRILFNLGELEEVR